MTVSCPTGWSDYVTALDTLAEQYKSVGIELIPPAGLRQRVERREGQGTYQLVIDAVGQGTAPPDPYYPYMNTFATDSTLPVGENGNPYGNVTRFSDPEVDEALETAAGTTDIEVKKEAYYTIQKKLSENLPAIPVLIGSSLTEYNSSRITGWPTQDDLYVYPMSWSAPSNAQVLKAVVPAE